MAECTHGNTHRALWHEQNRKVASVHCTNFSEKAQPCRFSLSASRLRISVVRVAAHGGLGQQWVTDRFAGPPVPPRPGRVPWRHCFIQGLEETMKRLQGNQHPQIHDRVSWICRFGTRYVEGQMMSNVTGKANFGTKTTLHPRSGVAMSLMPLLNTDSWARQSAFDLRYMVDLLRDKGSHHHQLSASTSLGKYSAITFT